MVIVGSSVTDPPNQQGTAFQFQLRFGVRTYNQSSELAGPACPAQIDQWNCYNVSNQVAVAIDTFLNTQQMNVQIRWTGPVGTAPYY